MAIIKCSVCNKRMITQDILEKHMVKNHSENQPDPQQQPNQVEMVNVTTPDGRIVKVPTAAIEQAQEVKKEDLDPNELITIVSADNRELEVSVGTEVWRGKIIQVKRSMESEVRRLLNDGGYYVKD